MANNSSNIQHTNTYIYTNEFSTNELKSAIILFWMNKYVHKNLKSSVIKAYEEI